MSSIQTSFDHVDCSCLKKEVELKKRTRNTSELRVFIEKFSFFSAPPTDEKKLSSQKDFYFIKKEKKRRKKFSSEISIVKRVIEIGEIEKRN